MKKMFIVFALSATILLAGVCVVHYNTGSLMYEQVQIFSYNKQSVTFLDITLYYKDVQTFADNIFKLLPEKPIACQKYV